MQPGTLYLIRHGERFDHIRVNWDGNKVDADTLYPRFDDLTSEFDMQVYNSCISPLQAQRSATELFQFLQKCRAYDPPLTWEGFRQSQFVANYLFQQVQNAQSREATEVLILTSPLVRCVQTAHQIAAALGINQVHVEYSLEKDVQRFFHDNAVVATSSSGPGGATPAMGSPDWLQANVSPFVQKPDSTSSWSPLVPESEYWQHFAQYEALHPLPSMPKDGEGELSKVQKEIVEEADRRKNGRSRDAMNDIAEMGFHRLLSRCQLLAAGGKEITVICVSHSSALESWFQTVSHAIHAHVGKLCMAYCGVCKFVPPPLSSTVGDEEEDTSCPFAKSKYALGGGTAAPPYPCVHYQLKSPYFYEVKDK